MKQVIEFLTDLSLNNNKEWFQAHKAEYQHAQNTFNQFTLKLIDAISAFDEDVAQSHLGLKDCTYRIYKDMRFSKEKVPYKTHFGAYINRGGKKSPYAGYYFHLEAPVLSERELCEISANENDFRSSKETLKCGTTENAEFLHKGNQPVEVYEIHQSKGLIGSSLLAAGMYCYEPKVLKSLRDEFSVNGDTFLNAIASAEGFELDGSRALRKVPAEFAFAPERWHGLLRQRDFSLCREFGNDYVLGRNGKLSMDGLVEKIAADFSKCKDYIHLLNMAIDYALEQ